PQPLTHPARDPGPHLAPGSSFIGPLWKTRHENLGARLRVDACARYPCGAGVGAGFGGPLPFGTKPGAFLCRLAAASRTGSRRLNPPHYQIIPVHHLRAAAEPEDRKNIGGGATFDLERILSVIGDEAAADLEPV